MATGSSRWRHDIFRQERARIYFRDFILWLGTVGSCLGERYLHFLNQRKSPRPKAQSIYQRIGEAPWGCIRKSWPDIVVATQSPESTLRHEWMELIMPRDATACRPDRVLMIGTEEDYMTVGHTVWGKWLFARGYDPTCWLVYE
jgi:hypothetical protein